jgi:hypothetical protein
MAYPILPLERLLMNRTGSIGSLVGPAVTSIFISQKYIASRADKRANSGGSGSEIRNIPQPATFILLEGLQH